MHTQNLTIEDNDEIHMDLIPPSEVVRPEVWLSGPLELTRFVVHDLCKFSGCDSLVGEGSGRQAAQGRMGAIFVEVAPPVLDAFTGIGQRQEPRSVQALCP